MRIAIACDHAGFDLKKALKAHLEELGHECLDLGAHSKESVDYPDYALLVAQEVVSGRCEAGVLLCSTGIGMAIAANKVKGVRAAPCTSVEMAKLARLHNNANVLALGARFIDLETAKAVTKAFLQTPFSGEERHVQRLEKIAKIESGT